MLVKRIPIYLQSFTSYRDISRKLQVFPIPLNLTPLLGCSHWNSGKSLVLRKLESWDYQAVKTV